jgi:hypothetical protein
MLKNIDLHVDWEQMHSDYEEVLSKALPNGWDESALIEGRQINLRGKDFLEKQYESKKPTPELYKLFSFWHPETPKYTRNIID